MMKGLLTFLIGGIAVAAASNIAKSKAELDEYEKKMFAKGGAVEGLEKELRRLQRELNSSRLRTYIEGDNSEEALARRKEREVKLARFNEVLKLLRESEPKLSKGGSIQKGDLVHVPSINKSGFVSNVISNGKLFSVKFADGVLNVYDRDELEKIKELASGGTIGQYEVIGSLRFIEAATPDNEVRVSTNVIADSKEDAIKKVKRMYGLDVAPDSDLYAELVESYE